MVEANIKSEKCIKTEFGFCCYCFDNFYDLTKRIEDKYKSVAAIYNLYVYKDYRRQGKARELLQNVINDIRYRGYKGKIIIQAVPRENSIHITDLVNFYVSMGLIVVESGEINA